MVERERLATINLDSLPTVLSVKQVAQLLGVHINTVRNWGNRGVLHAYRVGPRHDRRFQREDILSFLDGSGAGHSKIKNG